MTSSVTTASNSNLAQIALLRCSDRLCVQLRPWPLAISSCVMCHRGYSMRRKRLSCKIQLLTTVSRVSSPIIPNERECEKTTTVTPCTAIDSEADVALGRVRPGNVWIQASYCEGKDALCIEITSDVAPQTQDFCFHYELSMVLGDFLHKQRQNVYLHWQKREGTHPMVK